VTVIKINAISVPPDGGDELARRFAARAGAVDNQDGFEGFELLQPTDGRTTWLVVTRWRDEAAFDAWLTGPAFAHGHGGLYGHAEGHGHGGAHGHGHGGAHAEGHGHGHGHAEGHGQDAHAAEHGHAAAEQRPVAVSSELWSFQIAGGSPGQR
jgi:heme-degrading monooxygenase HmoA